MMSGEKFFKHLLLIFIFLGAISSQTNAHGEATLLVAPSSVAPNGTISVTGQEVEDGEIFIVSLESTTFVLTLGTVTVEGESFEQEFVIPDHVPAGTYQVRARTNEGEAISAELTVVSDSETSSPVLEPSATLMELNRSKSPSQIFTIVAVLLASATVGILLVRSKDASA
jgi:hypothetical protein